MIWVVGAGGMLGTEICRRLSGEGADFVGTDREVDFTDFSAVEKFALGKKIRAVVNCAAYTAVDNAESEPLLAGRLNADGPRNLARLCGKIGATLVHISTDYVFDGTGTRPYAEDDAISPLGVYGRTKADGERAVAEETADFYILRTAWLYGFDGRNFVYTMIRAMGSRSSVRVVDDQRGSPTFCGDLAEAVLGILRKIGTDVEVPRGTYHFTDEGETTWFGFASEIRRLALERGILADGNCSVDPCRTSDYPTPARRPAYSVLDKSKIRKALGIEIPGWEDSLRAFLDSPLFDRSRIS